MDDGDDYMDVNLTDLDLNREPENNPNFSGASTRFRSLMSEMDTAQDRVEERIRQLEAVVARARQRQRWRESRNNIESTYASPETDRANAAVPSSSDRTPERGKSCKRDSSHLISEALKIDDSDAKNKDKEGGSFYDCNICLELAKDPVLTPCGHLFCWACFYQVSKIDSDSKECPVCKGKVSDNTVIPIYGNNGGSEIPCETTLLGLKIPPRPKGQRIESIRQQSLSSGLSHSHVLEALRRIRINLGGVGSEGNREEGNNISILDVNSPFPHEQSTLRHRSSIQQVSRVLSESAASLSSLSSALNSAERLVEDLETVINNRLSRNVAPRAPFLDGNGNSGQPGNDGDRVPNLNEVVGFPVVVSSSETSDNLLRVLSRRTADNNGLHEALPPSSSTSTSSPSPTRRRNVALRSRRRRLN